MNAVKTAVLLAGLTALFGAVGYALGGGSGMVVALGLAAATNLFAYWNSDRLALSAHGAVEVDARTAPTLVALVAELATRAGLPMRAFTSWTTHSPTPSRRGAALPVPRSRSRPAPRNADPGRTRRRHRARARAYPEP
jgi:Zn-dependent protease with chaperone function